jgi:hypothetical protein
MLPSIKDVDLSAKLYGSFKVKDGTSKETHVGRFKDLQVGTIKYMTQPINVIHDVAVSNGITSCELFHALDAAGLQFRLSVSDKFSNYYCQGRTVRKIVDADLLFVVGYVSIVLADDRLSWKFPVSKLLGRMLRKMPIRPELLLKLCLYSPELQNLIRQKKIDEIAYDIFTTQLLNHFTFVRCMNTLNLDYFAPQRIQLALSLIAASLYEDGVLLIGRTLKNGVNNASLFRKSQHKFQLLEDINEGSEIKELILNLELS